MGRICRPVGSGGIGYCFLEFKEWMEFKEWLVLVHHLEYVFGKSLLLPPRGSSDRCYSSSSEDILDFLLFLGLFQLTY